MMRSIWPVRGYGKLGLSAALLLVLGARAFSQSPTATSDSPVVLDSGAITGVRSAAAPEIRAYLGVPFAAPPVGPLRWQPPRPPTKWEAVRACDHLGPACPQPGSPSPASAEAARRRARTAST
jgi:para-nitrobenzyl esterase